MHVFLTGATGVLGTATIPLLTKAGHTVTGIARSPEKAELLRSLGAEPVSADLFDRASLRGALDGADAVLHLATKIPELKDFRKTAAWLENDRIRTEGTTALVDAALDADVSRLVTQSIAFVYADGGESWLDENAAVDASGFLASAIHLEDETRRFTVKGGGQGTALRCGLFHSDDKRVRDTLDYARRGLVLAPGRAGAYTSTIHVDDVATAFVAALDAPAGLYNVAATPCTRAEYAAAIAAVVGRRRTVRPPRWAVRLVAGSKGAMQMRSQRVTSRHFRGVAGWRPEHETIDDILRAVTTSMTEVPTPTG